VKGNTVKGATIYRMCDRQYTYDELCDALEAEAATLPPEQWRDGVWDVNEYMMEASLVGIIETVEDGGEDEPHPMKSANSTTSGT
jgi:hypothetical protein